MSGEGSYSKRTLASGRRITKEIEALKSETETIQVVSSTEDTVVLKFLGPLDTKYHEWYEIEIEYPYDYPFRPCSITFVGNRPKHWFYWKKDNLSKNQDFGLFHGLWCPQITTLRAIEMINDSLIHPEKYEDKMSGQWDKKYRQEVDALFQ